MTQPINIACIGSRETPPDILDWMEAAGAKLVRAGYNIVTGNAPGADQAWARGGNSVDPSKVTLCLPWDFFEGKALHPRNIIRTLGYPFDAGFKDYYHRAAATHPAWGHMTVGGQRLHARNAMVVDGVQLVLGWMSPGGWGTESAFRIARMQGTPTRVVTVSDDVLAIVKKELKK